MWAPIAGADLPRDAWETIFGFVIVRASGRCEGCGKDWKVGEREPSIHHRRPRSVGGTADPWIHGLANLLALCGGKLAGVQGCHGGVESRREEAEAAGQLVPWGAYTGASREAPPEVSVPVLIGGRREVYLDPVSPLYLERSAAA